MLNTLQTILKPSHENGTICTRQNGQIAMLRKLFAVWNYTFFHGLGVTRQRDAKISYNEVLKRFNVSSGYLRYRFPLKTKIIIIRHKYYRRKMYVSKRLQQKKMIRNAVQELNELGIYPSKHLYRCSMWLVQSICY